MESNSNVKPELNQANLEKNKISRDFKGIWIPKEIWLLEGLSAQEKVLWAEIDSLYDEKRGGCYASNDYLCKFNGVKLRVLQNMLSNLKSKGLIEQVAFDGRVRTIKAIIPKKVAYEGCRKVHGSNEEYCTHITKTIYKEISSNEDTKKIARAPFIGTTNSEHKKLEEQYGEEKREWCYRRLCEWKEDKPKTQWSKSDYRTILRWVGDAYHEEQLKIKKRKGFDSVAKNKDIAAKIVTNFKEKAKAKDIRIDTTVTVIAFVFLKAQKNPVVIKYSDEGFEEQVNSFMRKYKLI